MISIMSLVSSNMATLQCRDWRRNNLQETTKVPKFNTIQSAHQRAPMYQLCMSFPTNSWPIFHCFVSWSKLNPVFGKVICHNGCEDWFCRQSSEFGWGSQYMQRRHSEGILLLLCPTPIQYSLAGKHLIYPHPCIPLWPWAGYFNSSTPASSFKKKKMDIIVMSTSRVFMKRS